QAAATELGELRPLGQGVVDEPHLGASVPGHLGEQRGHDPATRVDILVLAYLSCRYIEPIHRVRPAVVNHKQEGTCFVLDLAVLGLLKEAPMSGYELKKLLTVKLGASCRVRYGSLYPCLKRLAAGEALEVEVAPFTSRKKHVYRLTDHGNRLFLQLLETAEGPDLGTD